MSDYAIIGPCTIDSASACAGQGVAGIAAPTALVGLAHALERDLKAAGHGRIGVIGCAALVHDASFLDGHPKYPPLGNRLKSGSTGAEVIDEIRVRATMTFVFSLDVEGEDDAKEALDEAVTKLRALLPTKRFQGGSIHVGFGAPENLRGAVTGAKVVEAFKALPPGHVLFDASGELKGEEGKEGDVLDRVIDCVSTRLDGDKLVRVAAPGLCPISVGYRAIERPTRRPGGRSRNAPLHVYAESLISIGRWRHSRFLRRPDDGDPLSGAVWRPTESDGLFHAVVTS